jgi:hypothetical protein
MEETKIYLIEEEYPDEEILTEDGFDDAIIGVVYDNINGEHRVAYSIKKALDILMKTMNEEQAREYFDFHITGAYVGNKTPIWVNDEMFYR